MRIRGFGPPDLAGFAFIAEQSPEERGERQFWNVLTTTDRDIGCHHVRYGSLAVVQPDSSSMTALGRKADIQPGRMSALTDTGRSEALGMSDLNVSYRPMAASFSAKYLIMT